MVYGKVMQLGMLYDLSGNPKQTGQCMAIPFGAGDVVWSFGQPKADRAVRVISLWRGWYVFVYLEFQKIVQFSRRRQTGENWYFLRIRRNFRCTLVPRWFDMSCAWVCGVETCAGVELVSKDGINFGKSGIRTDKLFSPQVKMQSIQQKEIVPRFELRFILRK